MQILCRHMMCWLKAALTSQMPVGHIYNIKQTHGLNHNIMLFTVINRLRYYFNVHGYI